MYIYIYLFIHSSLALNPKPLAQGLGAVLKVEAGQALDRAVRGVAIATHHGLASGLQV